jgi:capsule polysaccharide export protein KpsE/RkpR
MVAAAARLQGEMMATQSELKGLEQIYTSNNVRVRALRARNEELQKQLQKLGGADSDSGSTDDLSGYPSIRKLPLLGVTYYDLFRQTKMLETVYEVLNQEYQLAKVQEAKELPNARVLDPADIPEKKAGPIRTLIMFIGMTLAFGAGVVWMLAAAAWQRIDSNDPRKELAGEILSTAKGRLLHMSSSKVWVPLHAVTARFNHSTAEQEASGGES